jgi:toxin YoeB
MKIQWTEDAWEDYLYWRDSDRKIFGRINDLIEDIKRSPFRGLGEPEPLKHALHTWWSRRIRLDHRLVYRVSGKDEKLLEIAQCRFHYK